MKKDNNRRISFFIYLFLKVFKHLEVEDEKIKEKYHK